MKPAVKLKLDGKDFCLKPPIPSVISIIRFLDKQPADELFTGDELSRRIGISANVVKSIGGKEELQPYSLRCGRARYWGNPRAIATLRAQLEAGQ